MLRTNTKKARENVRRYVVDHFDGTNYAPDFDDAERAARTADTGAAFPLVADAIRRTFADEFLKHNPRYNAGMLPRQALFLDWCAGLPSILDTCYFYNRSAVADLGDILEETEAERARFSERDAERMLSLLIYRELYR